MNLRVPILACAGLLVAATAAAKIAAVGTLPAALQVPDAAPPSTSLHARGVQIYTCQSVKDEPAKFAWTLKAPEAELFDGDGRVIGHHYAGPTWEAQDGSKVAGEVVAKEDSPKGRSIAWLLLNAKSTSGSGIFSRTHAIQRLHTRGGKAPVDGCAAADAGHEKRIPYSADYYFYDAKP